MDTRDKTLRRFVREKVRELRGKSTSLVTNHAVFFPDKPREDGYTMLLMPNLADSWDKAVGQVQLAVRKQNPWAVCVCHREGDTVSLHLQTLGEEGESWIFQVRPSLVSGEEVLTLPEKHELRWSFLPPRVPRKPTS